MGRGGGGGGGGGKGGNKGRFGGGSSIGPDEVREFTSHSKVKGELIHRTTEEAAAAIHSGGVDPARSVSGLYGRGFYASTAHEHGYGAVEVRIAVDARKVLRGRPAEIKRAIAKFAEASPGPGAPTRFSQDLRAKGYDAIVVNFKARSGPTGGESGAKKKWVIVLNPSSARVVRPSSR